VVFFPLAAMPFFLHPPQQNVSPILRWTNGKFDEANFEHNNNPTLSSKPNAEHAAVEPWHLVALWSHG
jgi:hypothetical protein